MSATATLRHPHLPDVVKNVPADQASAWRAAGWLSVPRTTRTARTTTPKKAAKPASSTD